MKFIIGIDIGTTSTKAVLYGLDGSVHGKSSQGYELYKPKIDIAEQKVEDIYQAVIESLRKCIHESGVDSKQIKGISFSAAMHSLMIMDSAMRPLTNVITWADNRAHFYSEPLKKSKEGQDIYERTGTPIHPMSPLAKLLWMRNEYPALLSENHFICGIKEYLFYRFFGDFVMDESIASATGLYNLKTRQWDTKALQLVGICEEQLPRLVSVATTFQGIDKQLAQYIGISPQTPFIIGASDGVLSNLGVDAIHNEIAITIGTSAAVRTVVSQPVTDHKGRLFCYVLDDEHWVLGGPINNGGIVFQWVRDQLFTPEKQTAEQMRMNSYDLLTKIASHIPAGADGLIFLPFLGGERAPLWDANARGTFFGLTHHHTRDHMLRSALEGIVFNLYTVLLAIEEVTDIPKSIKATGGFARSELWKQMLADIFEIPVEVPKHFESSCLGAAVIGMKALGLISSIDEVNQMVGTTSICLPNEDNFEVYRQLMPIYIRLSRTLNGEYDAIAEFQRKFIH